MSKLDKKIIDLQNKSRYLRHRTFKCDTDAQTQRVRKEQDTYYKEMLFLMELRKCMEVCK